MVMMNPGVLFLLSMELLSPFGITGDLKPLIVMIGIWVRPWRGRMKFLTPKLLPLLIIRFIKVFGVGSLNKRFGVFGTRKVIILR